MTVFEQMDLAVNQYTKTDLNIYETIKKFQKQFIELSINELVSMFGFSQAALTRYAKKLGYDGFMQFQYQLKVESQNMRNSSTDMSRAKNYGALLETAENTIDAHQLSVAAEKIKASNCVYLGGYNLARIPAEYLEMGMRIMRIYNPVLMTSEDFPNFSNKNQNVIILFSAYNGTAFQMHMKNASEDANHPYIILVTMNPKHPIKKYADQVFVLPESHMNGSSNKAITETFAFLMFADLLIEALDHAD